MLEMAFNHPNQYWYIDDLELNYFEFQEGMYDYFEFKKRVYELSCLSFARFRRYPADSILKKIDTYIDYIESKCEILILFYDGGYFEVFCKEATLCILIYEFAEKVGLEKIEYITDGNNDRESMHF